MAGTRLPAFAGVIDTYVGGEVGDGAPAVDAIIDPRGLITVGSGAATVYISDGRNGRVRRVDANGLITTVAGNGIIASSGDGGAAQDASLMLPLDVAADSAGNLYISDYRGNRIRKVTPGGQISTFAGNGTLSYSGDGGLATQAALYNPWGIAFGPDGYLYIADSGNNRIRKVGPPGCTPQTCVITTAVGNGTFGFGGDGGLAANCNLRVPADVAFDRIGNMFIADSGNQRIRMVAAGIITSIAGGGTIGTNGSIGDGGPAIGSVLRYPVQVTVDSAGIVYITDTQQRRIRMIQNGLIYTLAGTGNAGDGGDGGPAANADMYLPYGVAVDGSGAVWISTTADVAISQHNRVRRVTTARIIDSVVGGGMNNGGAANDALVDPRGVVAVDSGGALPDLYLADGNNNVVRRVRGTDATIYVIAGTGEAGYSGDGGSATAARLHMPLDVAVDPNGNVYVADSSNNAVRRISNGIITTVAGNGARGYSGDGGPATQAQLAGPTGVAVDANGTLYIADYNNNRVRRVANNGVITTIAGNGGSGYGGDGGPATAATLRSPWDVAVASDGSVYIADTFNERIRKIAPNGVISTYAGVGVAGYDGDGGPATAAKLDAPALLSLDAFNRLFVADRNNERVRAIDPKTNKIKTVAGIGQPGVSGDGGPATAASFSAPSGVAVNPGGDTLFIAANDDARVRMADVGGCAIVGQPATRGGFGLLLLAPLAVLGALRRRGTRR